MPVSRRICRSYEELVEYLPQWEQLIERSERNIFYEPAMLLPAIKHLAVDEQPFVVLIFDGSAEERLVGLFPTIVKNNFRRMRMRHFTNWKYEHAFYCAPLIEKGRENDCVDEVLSALHYGQPDISSYCFELIDHDTCLFGVLSEQQGFVSHAESYQRAQLDVNQCDPAQILTSKHRKDLRRRERRLGDLGDLTVHFDEARTNLKGWIGDFLELEANGWKGKNDSAMACKESDRRFFTEATEALGDADRLLITSMRLDNRLIATTCDLLSGDRAFAFKIAYDEELGRFSPGIIVAMKHTENLKHCGRIAWADSCAQQDSEMANRLYPARRTISAIMLAREATAAGLVTNHVLPTFRAATSKLSQAASAIRTTTAKK